MRILLDENTPRGVRRILTGHDVRTAPEMGWAAIANGKLLDEAEKAGFDALITSDQNFVFQQNLLGRNIAVVVLSTKYVATNTSPAADRAARRRQRHTRKLHRRDVRPPAQTPPGTRPQMLKQPCLFPTSRREPMTARLLHAFRILRRADSRSRDTVCLPPGRYIRLSIASGRPRQSTAILHAALSSAKLNDLDWQAWLADVIDRVA